MTTIPTDVTDPNNKFSTITEAFLQQPGLPFANVLSPQFIRQAFADENGLFAQDKLFSTQIVLWGFLAQTLRDGKGAACMQAVADIVTYMQQTGQPIPSGDTGDYCRARAKLKPAALRRLIVDAARQMEANAEASWLWKGLHAKLVDGFTLTMADTPANQERFPQLTTQTPGVGLPIARACVVLSLATAGVCDAAIGPYAGKETGEPALLRQILDTFDEKDVIVFDRYYCSYMMMALLVRRGMHVCARLHQGRNSDFRRGRRLGPDDHLITWTRPARPAWMSPEDYEMIPETLTLREVRFDVTVPGHRPETLTVVTTLTDPEQYSSEDIAELYGFRWNVELDIRQIKQSLHLDFVPCKSPEMVCCQLWVTLLAYNLIRKVIATAAAVHDKQPRRLGFVSACQTVLSSWMLLSTGRCRDGRGLCRMALAQIAAHEVGNRPGRIEPRVLKRRRHRYPLMRRPRHELRRELRMA
jgi:putative transposase